MPWVADKAFIAYRKAGLAVLEPLARRRAAAHGLPALMAGRPAQAKPPIWNDLWFLYRNVRDRRPKLVLEFGSGCSTIVIAAALAENAAEGAPGRLHSLDADPQWGEATRRSMPARLAGVCEITVTPALPVDYAGTPAWRHQTVPDIAPDLVYLDGPALAPGR
jgi:predicted O-methyltransferase YrrM